MSRLIFFEREIRFCTVSLKLVIYMGRNWMLKSDLALNFLYRLSEISSVDVQIDMIFPNHFIFMELGANKDHLYIYICHNRQPVPPSTTISYTRRVMNK